MKNLPPEIIDRLKIQHERDDRPALRVPLPKDYEQPKNDRHVDDENKNHNVIVIDLL